MKVQRIEIKNFMSHDATEIDLPDRGVVVLMGPNGAGKSALVETVSVAHWGRTLRGTPAWRKGEAGELIVHSSLASIRRTVAKGGTKSLRWCEAGRPDFEKYDTNTKAEHELARDVGDFEMWRRTHVFSSSDAMNFSTSSDGKRKRFIEQILGLDRFDTAATKCKADLFQQSASLGIAHSTLTHAQELRAAAVESLATTLDPTPNLPTAPEPLPEPEGGRALMTDHAAELSATEEAIELLNAEPTDTVDPVIVEAFTVAATELRLSAQRLELAQTGKCGECEQVYELSSAEDAAIAHEAVLAQLDVARAGRTEEESRVTQASAARRRRAGELQAEVTRLRGAYDTMARGFDRVEIQAGEIARHQAHFETARLEYEKTLTRNRERRADLNGKIFDHDDEIDGAEAEIVALTRRVTVLEYCMQVLGLKGVRVPVLGHALEAAEFIANGGLAGLGRKGLKIRLRPYRVLESGKTNSDIGFEVEGAGGGYGYDATSGGERRRLDASLLLAFAEVSSVGGGPDGTLWIDELFDAIDAEGCTAAAQMLADIGKRRCVVVITHREDLAREIDAVARYRVVDGVLNSVA